MVNSGIKKKLFQEIEKIPLKVAVEPTNICNANCSFCAYRYSTRKKAVMDSDVYKEVLKQIIDFGCRELKFTPIIGDPFTDLEFIQKIKYARLLNWFNVIYTYTNLIGLEPDKVDDFVTSGLTNLIISTCLQDRESFKRIFGVDKFDKVINNIITLLESNKKHGFPIDIAISLRHDKDFNLANNTHYRKILKFKPKVVVLNDNYDNWGGLIKLQDLPKGQLFRRERNKKDPCAQLYNGFIITSSGEVGICWCRDFNLDLKIGNIYQNNLREIWEGDKLRNLRKDWLEGKLPKLCINCLEYTSVLEHNSIQKYILKHIFKYPFFLLPIIKSKIQKLMG